jgi:hypothetical protein
MSTEAQINANQQNAQKSTGPRTAEGKAAVSQNAVKHGLFASEAVIKGENQADFDLYRDEMLGELAPVGMVESMLAERFVSLSWRLRRLERMQNQAIDVMMERDGPSPLTLQLRSQLPKFLQDVQVDMRGSAPELILGRAAIKDCANYNVLGRLSIYERRIENSMFKTMRELERLQMLRKLEEEAAEEQSIQAIPKACGFEAATPASEEESVPEPDQAIPSTALRTGPSTALRTGPIPINDNRDEAATRTPADKEVNLKKQSQFAPALMGVNALVGEDYENKCRPESRENKAKQSQTKPISGLGVVSREESAA